MAVTEQPVSLPTASDETRPAQKRLRVEGFTVVVLAVILVGTATASFATSVINDHNNTRLLGLQVKQAGSVIAEAIPSIQTPLASAAEIAATTNGAAAQFRHFIAPYVDAKAQFSSAALWRLSDGPPVLITAVGRSPLVTKPSASASLFRITRRTHLLSVVGLLAQSDPHLEYAYLPTGSSAQFGVTAASPLSANKHATVQKGSPFSELNFAIYLGTSPRADALLESTEHLPITGQTAMVTVPFGDSAFTIVGSAVGDFGGAFATWLPWIIAILGTLFAILAAVITERLLRGRRAALRASAEIGRLYSELDQMFGQQRTIAETLQHALLPEVLPGKPGVEVATRYVAGAAGTEIGGDWYGFVPLDGEKFGFQIGDVSGRGVDAAKVMAALRYTIRAFTLAGYSPTEILDQSAKQVHIGMDGHFATALVGVGDVERREMTLVNAGHLNPLVIDGEKAEFVPTALGVPLGVGGGTYQPVTVSVPPGATVIAFTDGLVERRGEGIDIGLKRLEEAARGKECPLDELLTAIITELTDETTNDDIAILGFRWTT